MQEVIALPVSVQAYFDTVNRKDFEATARLFAAAGTLVPPFDKPIEGRSAIAAYLTKEASDMTFTPITLDPVEAEDNLVGERFAVKGKVKSSLFVVNVGWQFDLHKGEIQSVKVKLLASLKELMNLRS